MGSVLLDLLEYWHAGWRHESMPQQMLLLLAIAGYSHCEEVTQRMKGQLGINPYLDECVVCRLR